jgi:ketosteroid isomerase-like protein
MRRLLAAAFTVALIACPLYAQETGKTKATPTTASKGSGVKEALLELENKWAKESSASNADGVAPLLASDFVNTDSDGKVTNKTQTLAAIKGSKWEVNEISDMKVLVHGNAGVVAGAWRGKGTDSKGKKVDAKERWTDTWVKMTDGSWQCIASQSTAIK